MNGKLGYLEFVVYKIRNPEFLWELSFSEENEGMNAGTMVVVNFKMWEQVASRD